MPDTPSTPTPDDDTGYSVEDRIWPNDPRNDDDRWRKQDD